MPRLKHMTSVILKMAPPRGTGFFVKIAVYD